MESDSDSSDGSPVGAVDILQEQDDASDVAAGQGHRLCEQPAPSTSNPVRPVGGSVSTSTALVSKHASDDQVSELLKALVPGGEETPYNTTVETRADSQSDIKEIHVHLTQTNIHNPAAIALGGQVVVNPPKEKVKKSETVPSPSEIQKLRSATERTVEKWTGGMIRTQATQIVLEKISQGRTWITITGSPGEGKTTSGYLVLKHLQGMGRDVYDIKTPEDYFKVKGSKGVVIMLNDIFGSLRFDLGKIKTWESVLSDVLAANEHRVDEMKERKDRKAGDTVILISRSSVLNAASHHLGRFKDLVLKKESVVDFTHGQDFAVEERMKIWKYHSEKYKISINWKSVREVCEMALPHGFPHCCRLFAEMYSKNKKLSMKFFFTKPVEFLNQTMESLIMDAVTGVPLREMLKNDGSLMLNSITDDEKRFQYTSVVQTLKGIYLKQDRTTVTFHHPSVYDSAAFVVCTKDPMFVIKHCTLSFLNDRVKFSGLHPGMEAESQHKVTIDNEYVSVFLDRLKTEFQTGNISLILSNQSFHDEDFVSKFMQCILPPSEVQPLSDSIQHLIHRTDKESKKSFLFLMAKSRSDKLLRYICHLKEMSQEEQTETLFGICEHSSVSAMQYFLSKFQRINFNVKNSSFQTPLLLASTKTTEQILKTLLEKDVDVNQLDKDGNSVLDNICKHGVDEDSGVVTMLVKKGVDVNKKSSNNSLLPLHAACLEGHNNVIVTLLECGADIDKEDSYGDTALVNASRMNHLDVATLLLDRGAIINRTGRLSDSALSNACYEGHVNVVSLLLDRGADINKTSSGGNTPLHLACYLGHVDIVTVLLDRGAAVNKTNSIGDTPLHRACNWGCVDVVTLLTDRGADINQTDSCGDTPLHRACLEGHKNIVTVLLDKRANINQTDTYGNTPLNIACLEGHMDVVTVLLDGKADINEADSHGDTPLHKACYKGHGNVVAALLQSGADINKMNINGNVPLFSACYRGNVDVVTLLLNRGADITTSNSTDYTPLHRACNWGHVDVVGVLLDRGADINKTNSTGETPLHRACKWGNANVVTVLLDRGADVNKINSFGDTPLQTALKGEHVDVITVLKGRVSNVK